MPPDLRLFLRYHHLLPVLRLCLLKNIFPLCSLV